MRSFKKTLDWLLVFILVIAMMISISSLITDNWIKSDSWSGGLLRCTSGIYKGKNYWEIPCIDHCIYKKYSQAALIYLVFTVFFLACSFIWLFVIIHQILSLTIISRLIRLCLFLLAFSMQLVAVGCWLGITKISFGNGKEIAMEGPILSILSCALLPFAGILYQFSLNYYSEDELQELPDMDSIQVENRKRWHYSLSSNDEHEESNNSSV
ncbi:hypothetical protein SteCoe_12776 [Stentor coeruleus]|uniref:Uncharacterized protein n=1 Tax=Stentor coeruleus TaxID=5963 RepID=A0A1R2C9V9_9CILI|nr:hypothetical protein SteCoe_12776 [Stentor coeruleus]